MGNWKYQVKGILNNNRDGAYGTMEARKDILLQAGSDLHSLGYRVKNPAVLKPKHVHILVEHWQSKGLNSGTIKNRMTHLRWLATKTNNQFVKKTNAAYGIDNRQYVKTLNRADNYRPENIPKVTDTYVKMSLELQRAFGLRREEAIKFSPGFADRKTHIELKPGWTKGGRGRIIEIRTQEQRQVLDRAHQLVGSGSLIPTDKRYSTQRSRFEYFTKDADIGDSHGARHAYAQTRYKELTGLNCKYHGGPGRGELRGEQRDKDTLARERISAELGHSRIAIVAVYLGG